MNVKPLEFLGRLTRAKGSVKIAQEEIDAAMQLALEREPIERQDIDLSASVATALVNAHQAVADLEALGEMLKPL